VEDVDNIALSEADLKALEQLDLSSRPGLDRVRDQFLVGCYTGLRFSDFSRLTADNIRDGFIEITQQKTGKPVVIPIHQVVSDIIAKYEGGLPEAISQQKTNDYLKDICKQVKSFREKASKTKTTGGMRTTVNYEKWEIVTTHTARRTFATNAYRQGIPTISIMAITGHKTERSFLKYIKVTSKEHAKIMAGVWNRNEMEKVN
jgi:integrase